MYRGEPFENEVEALKWLCAQPADQLEITLAELARRWARGRVKAIRRAPPWPEINVPARITAASSAIKAAALPLPAPPASMPAPVTLSMPAVSSGAKRPSDSKPDVRPTRRSGALVRGAGGAVLAGIALAIAWHGLRINAWYGETLGKTAEASALLAGLSVSADALALVLPTVARMLWVEGNRSIAAMAWSVWSLTVAIALMATVGFAALNIADTTAARDQIAAQRSALASRIERLRSERTSVAETRSVATIQAEIQRAQPGAAAVWHATSGCTNVTRSSSGEACAEVLRIRQSLGSAQRRDAIDEELREAETQLSHLPPVITADPQAETAADLLNWMTRNLSHVAPRDIHMARVFGMTLLPQISGLVFMFAMALWQSARRRPLPDRPASHAALAKS